MSDPTPAMKQRSQAWLSVIDHVDTYLKAAAQRYDGIYAATTQLSRDMPQPTNLDAQFAPVGHGGIQDLFAKLWWDLNLPDGKAAENASSVIKNELLKDVELLRGDLNRSISEFDDMSASFTAPTDNTLAPSKTQDTGLQKRITEFGRAVNAAELGKQPDIDPYILKLQLDRKIESYVKKHNRQADSYAYVQDAAKRVDGEVTERLQSILRKYTDIVEQNAKIIAAGAQDSRTVFINQPKLFEYKYWLSKTSAPASFTGSNSKSYSAREAGTDVKYPSEDSPYAKAIRVGTLERRTKFLHTYSAGEYVLTPLSLIEIRHNAPVWAIDLVGAKLRKDHKAAKDKDQFVILGKQHGSSSGKQHSFVFRAKVASNWIRDLEKITGEDSSDKPGKTSAKTTEPPTSETAAVPGLASITTEAKEHPAPEALETPTSSTAATPGLAAVTDKSKDSDIASASAQNTSAVPTSTKELPTGSAKAEEEPLSETAATPGLASIVAEAKEHPAPGAIETPTSATAAPTSTKELPTYPVTTKEEPTSEKPTSETAATPGLASIATEAKEHPAPEAIETPKTTEKDYVPVASAAAGTPVNHEPAHASTSGTHGQVFDSPASAISPATAAGTAGAGVTGATAADAAPVSSGASLSDMPAPILDKPTLPAPTSGSATSGIPDVPTERLSGLGVAPKETAAPAATGAAPLIADDDSEGEVSDVEQPYDTAETKEGDGSLAWKAKRDMAAFE